MPIPVSSSPRSLRTANTATAGEPVLLTLGGSATGRLHAADVLEFGTKRIKTLDGKPVFEDGNPVFIPVFVGDPLNV